MLLAVFIQTKTAQKQWNIPEW